MKLAFDICSEKICSELSKDLISINSASDQKKNSTIYEVVLRRAAKVF